jgi:hypothetical protein
MNHTIHEIQAELLGVSHLGLIKLRGFGPLANYAERATAASWRSSANFCG